MHNPSLAQRPDEIFDVVNESDEVIGTATRGEVHARKLWHRAVHVMVVGKDGRIFLQKRSLRKDTAPGRWDSACSGHVDSGEDYVSAAVRELNEEIGLVIAGPEALTPLFRLSPCEDTGWEFLWIFQLRSDGPFVLNPAEIDEGRWISVEELSQGLKETPDEFTRALRCLWQRYTEDGSK